MAAIDDASRTRARSAMRTPSCSGRAVVAEAALEPRSSSPLAVDVLACLPGVLAFPRSPAPPHAVFTLCGDELRASCDMPLFAFFDFLPRPPLFVELLALAGEEPACATFVSSSPSSWWSWPSVRLRVLEQSSMSSSPVVSVAPRARMMAASRESAKARICSSCDRPAAINFCSAGECCFSAIIGVYLAPLGLSYNGST